MSDSDIEVSPAEDDDENDNVTVLRSAYRALARLQTNLDNLDASMKKGEQSAAHHLAIAKANATEALQLVTQVGKSKIDK